MQQSFKEKLAVLKTNQIPPLGSLQRSHFILDFNRLPGYCRLFPLITKHMAHFFGVLLFALLLLYPLLHLFMLGDHGDQGEHNH